MERKTRILMLDDSAGDLEIIERELRRGGIVFTAKWAQTREAYLEALKDFIPDLILSDHGLPSFDGFSALGFARKEFPEIPFILVSGLMGEELAIDSLKCGATDYVLKDRLARLVPAVKRALHEVRQRQGAKRAEAAVRESEAKFAAFAENLPAIIFIHQEGKFCYVNAAAERILGYSREELLSMRFWEVIHPKFREQLRSQGLRRQQGEPVPAQSEFQIIDKSGITRWLACTAARTELAGSAAVMGSAFDITARKEAEVALLQAEAKYHGIFQNAIEGIFQSSPNGRFLSANPALAQMLGYASPEELIASGTDFDRQHYVNPSDRKKARQVLETQGIVRGFEVQICRKDLSKIWISIDARAVRDPHGEILYFEGTQQDITARKKAEASLLESERRFRQVVEQIREVFWMSDPKKNRMLYISPAYEQVWGRSCASLYASSRDWLEAIHPEDRERVLQAALTQQVGGDYRETYRIVRPDGSIRWIEDRAFPIRNEEGKVYRVTGIAEDITERKQAAEELHNRFEELAAAKETLATQNQELCLARELIATERQRYQDLFEFAPDAYLLTDANGAIREANQAAATLLRVGAELLVGMPLATFVALEDRPRFRQEIVQFARAGDKLNNLQFELQPPKGPSVPVAVTIGADRDGRGHLRATRWLLTDITERKRADAVLCAFSRLGLELSAASTSSDAARIVVEIASTLFGWDACYLHLYSPQSNQILPVLTMDTIQGEKVGVPDSSFTPAPSPLMLEIMREGPRLVNRDPPSSVSGAGVPPANLDPLPLVPFGDASRRSASMMYVPIRHGTGTIGILSIQSYTHQAYTAEDLVTFQTLADHCAGALERIRAVMNLRQTELRSGLLLSAVPHWMFRVGKNGAILDYKAPQRFASEAGVLSLTNKNVFEIGPSQLMEQFRDCMEKAFSSGREQIFEFQHILRGELCHFEAQVVAGDEAEVLAIIRDVSERKRLETEVLNISAREQRRIGYDLHDGLGQFLAGVAVRAKLLEDSLREEKSPHLAEAKTVVGLMNNAIRQARTLAHGLDPVNLDATGLPSALQRLANETASVFRVNCSSICNRCVQPIDRRISLHIYHIAQEAVHNAIKHGRANHIELELDPQAGQICLAVRDNGKGFDWEKTDRTGMGLRIMKYRAHSLGGIVKISSKLSHGTEVRCTVPRTFGLAVEEETVFRTRDNEEESLSASQDSRAGSG